MHRFLGELKRRHVFRVAGAYAIAAWVVVQVADTVAPRLGLPGWFPTAVIVAAALGFPLALVFAWAFDLTADGVERTASPASRPSPAPSAASGSAADPPPAGVPALPRRIPAAAVAALAGVALLAAGATFLRVGGPAAPEAVVPLRSIAVLPFVNMSSDRENEHFSDGLAEELLNSLAQVPELRVAARTSSFAFKGAAENVSDIGRRLNVETVLEGSVRKSGDRLRITAQLINVQDGYHLWSETYERRLEDIFAIQDEISAAIVGSLLPRLEGKAAPAHHATESVEAYELYLRGRHRFWQGSTEAGLREAAALFEKAIAADPGFAPAYAGVADAYMLLGGQLAPRDAMPRAKAAARRALELDPRLAEGYVALASIAWLYDWDWAAADEHYRLSFSVNPLLHTRCICYAWYLAVVGNTRAAVVEAERARQMDPVARLPHVILAWMYYLDGQPGQAAAELDRLFGMAPEDVSGRRIAAWLAWDQGRRDEAVAELEGIRDSYAARGGFTAKGPPIVIAELATMYAAAGRPADAETLASALARRAAAEYVAPEYVAAALAAAGRMDEAFGWLDRAYENRSNLGQFSILPVSRPLRDDPRFATLLERIGLRRSPRAARLPSVSRPAAPPTRAAAIPRGRTALPAG